MYLNWKGDTFSCACRTNLDADAGFCSHACSDLDIHCHADAYSIADVDLYANGYGHPNADLYTVPAGYVGAGGGFEPDSAEFAWSDG